MKTTKKELSRLAKLRGEIHFTADCRHCGSGVIHFASNGQCRSCKARAKRRPGVDQEYSPRFTPAPGAKTKKGLAADAQQRGGKTFTAPCLKCEETATHYVSDRKCIPCMRQRKGVHQTRQELAQESAEKETRRRLQAAERAAHRAYEKLLRHERKKSGERHSVYMITNLYTGKTYIGSSIELEKRWGHHRYLLKHGAHPIEELQEDYEIHGAQAFSFREVYSSDPSLPVWKLRRVEERYIKCHRGLLYNSKYWLGRDF